MVSISTVPQGVSLREVLPDGQFFGQDDVRFTACSLDVAHCQPGDLFAAVVSAEQDAHESAAAAVTKGASGVVCERLLPIDAPQCIVDNVNQAYGRVCHALAGNPSQLLNLIGVAGTDGKTTTSRLIQSILGLARRRQAWRSERRALNPGHSPADSVPHLEMPTPMAPAVGFSTLAPQWWAHRLAELALAGQHQAIIEVPTDALAWHHFSGIGLDAVAITNVRRDPRIWRRGARDYRAAIAASLELLKPSGVAILNADDPTTHQWLDDLQVPAVTVGIRQPAEIQATLVERNIAGQVFRLSIGHSSALVHTTTIGDAHISNALLAAAAAHLQGIDLATIAAGIEQARPLAGQLERIECGQSFAIFIDQCQSPVRLASTLHAISRAKTAAARVWCVLGAPATADAETRRQLGAIAERHCHTVMITASSESCHAPSDVLHDVLDGFERPAKACLCPNGGRAIEFALELARPGDAILVAGDIGEASAAPANSTFPRGSIGTRRMIERLLATGGRCPEDSDPQIYRLSDYV